MGAFSFVPLRRSDFPLVSRWLDDPVVGRWWAHDTSPEAVERDFGPPVDGIDSTRVFLAWTGGRPIGLIQRYRIGDEAEYLAELSTVYPPPAGAVSIDYLVGEPDCRGRGLGTAMIGEFVTASWAAFPDATAVVVAVHADNVASGRALRRAGFRLVAAGELAPDNPADSRDHHVYRFDHDRIDRDRIDRDRIDAALAARLVSAQFPRWAELPVVPVEEQGWDNRTFRLGAELTIRMPTAEWYVASVEKEATWLPRLAPHLPQPVPEPLAVGAPSAEYPWPWSVRRWLPGRPAAPGRLGDPVTFAVDVAGFLTALQLLDAAAGPRAGAHSFYRGAALDHYDEETRRCVATLGPRVDGPRAMQVWAAALTAPWRGEPVWFHGDVAAGNLLVDDAGRLCAVIDFGTCGVGDPACDLVLAWTLLDGPARAAFRGGLAADPAMWARARGWALWKALSTLAGPDTPPTAAADAGRVIESVLAEHSSSTTGDATR